jgi:hypothetical protein
MPISVVCPKCSAKLNAPDAAAGKNVKCPKCQAAIAVPAPLPLEEAPDFEVVDEAPPAKKPAPAAKPAVRPVAKARVEEDDEDEEQPRKKRAKAADDEDDEEDDQPRKKKKKKQAEGNPMMVRNIIGGVVLLVLLGVAGWVFYDKLGKKKEEDTASSSSSGGGEAAPVTPRIGGGPAMPGMPGMPPVSPVGPVGGAGGAVGPGGGRPPAGGAATGNRGERLAEMFRQVRDMYVNTRKSMEAVSDGPTGQAAAKQLRAATQQIDQFMADLKTMQNLTPAEAMLAQPPADFAQAGQGIQAGMTKLKATLAKGVVPQNVATEIQQALLAWGQANVNFGNALMALGGKKK